jgi:hypothetical protein
MSSGSHQVGEISPDGMLVWDGRDWTSLARGRREATSWTLPLRRVTAVYLVLAALQIVVSAALFVNRTSVERVDRARQGFAADQLQAAVSFDVATAWLMTIVVAAVTLLLALGSARGWRSAFWAAVVWLGLSSIRVVRDSLALASHATGVQPAGALVVELLFSIAALALLLWLALAAARFGPWAMRKAGPR